MFTGIIEHQGTIESLTGGASGGRIVVSAPKLAASLKIAASVAVNGCCLTVVERWSDGFAVDLSPETLRRTTFGQLKPGARLNLEQPLGAGAELGGHFVQGHVDGIARVVRLASEVGSAKQLGARQKARRAAKRNSANSGEASWWLEIDLPRDIARYVAEKGSLAVDGISLTVAGLRSRTAAFAIIPYTYEHTNISTLARGSGVNVEADILAKYVERLVSARRQRR